MIDITMTAALRPEIVERTLKSISDHIIFNGILRLIIDIAPVGDNKYNQLDILNIAPKYFSNINIRTRDISYQAEALIWAWRNAESEFILNWEDDWELLEDIYFDKLIEYFNYYRKLAAINFDRQEKSILNYPGYKDKFELLNKNLYQRKMGYSLGGPPALIRGEFIKQALKYVNPFEYFDITSRKPEVQSFLNEWDHATLIHYDGPYVKDLGKEWRKKHGLKMVKDTSIGVQWVKADG